MRKKILSSGVLATVLATLLWSGAPCRADNFSGYIQRSGDTLVLAPTDSPFSSVLRLNPTDSDTASTLSRLQTGDYLIGSGTPCTAGINLEHIDFVGLKALLGGWTDTKDFFQFVNYSAVNVGTIWASGLAFSGFQYSLTPAEAGSWRLFLTDAIRPRTARMIFDGESLGLQFFDLNTGALQELKRYQRVPNEPNFSCLICAE